eukprot:2833410-Prymnesium_polylepis.1
MQQHTPCAAPRHACSSTHRARLTTLLRTDAAPHTTGGDLGRRCGRLTPHAVRGVCRSDLIFGHPGCRHLFGRYLGRWAAWLPQTRQVSAPLLAQREARPISRPRLRPDAAAAPPPTPP